MKIKNIILLSFTLLTTVLTAQLNVAFKTYGMTDAGNEVSAEGILSFYNNKLNVLIENTSENASLVGFWINAPDLTIDQLHFTTLPWEFQDSTPKFMSNLVNKTIADDYFGWMLDSSDIGLFKAVGWSYDLLPGETFWSRVITTGILNEFDDELDMVFRWQRVGIDGEDSAKTVLSFEDDVNISIPEPSVLGLFASVCMMSIVFLRRNR